MGIDCSDLDPQPATKPSSAQLRQHTDNNNTSAFNMSLKEDAWPSSAGFDLIADALKDDAQKQDAIKKGGNIFAFTLKNDQGKEESWHIDLKETGTVGKGLAPKGKKPGVTLVLSDVEFAKAHLGQGQRPKHVHAGQAEDQGQHDGGDQVRSYFGEGPEQGQVVSAERTRNTQLV